MIRLLFLAGSVAAVVAAYWAGREVEWREWQRSQGEPEYGPLGI